MSIQKSSIPSVPVPSKNGFDAVLIRAKELKDKVALIDGITDSRYTFDEISTRAKKAACALSKSGVRKGDVLMIISPNCLDFPVVVLGCMALGVVVAAINPLSTPKELTYLLQDSGAKFVVLHPMVIPNYEASDHHAEKNFVFGNADGYQSVSTFFEQDHSTFAINQTIDIKNDVAMMFYSSGTTGAPKGVMLSHFNINAIFTIAQRIFDTYPELNDMGDVYLGLLPFFHIYGGLTTLLLRIVTGKTLIVLPRFEPERFLGAIEKYRITALNVVPPLVRFLAKSPLVDKFDLSSVVNIVCGGASLGLEIGQLASQRLKLKELNQGFGMTENCGASHFPPPGSPDGSVGQILPLMESKVIDRETKQILNANEIGEICVRGPNVMLGYWNKPDATAETVDKDGWLLTGDIGYYDTKGYYYLVDRIKELIKYKGFQVAPAELESILNAHEDVLESAVVGLKDEEAGELPKAIVVKRPNSGVTENDLIAYVNGKVSPHKKLRGGIVFVTEIPKLPSGKLLRRILREMYGKP